MKIRSVKQKNYRNLVTPEIQFGDGLNFLFGQNGQGKTNLLEALSLIYNGKSFRPVSKNAFINLQNSEAEAKLQIEVERLGVKYNIVLNIAEKRVTAVVDNKKRSSYFLTERFPIIVFSPESLDAVKGGPELRRNLVDQTVLFADYEFSKTLELFNKVLRTRNKVLKDIKNELIAKSEGLRVLAGLEPSFLTLSTELITKRIGFLRKFESPFTEAFQRFIGNKHKKLSFTYFISGKDAKNWDSQAIFDALQKRITELESAELSLGTSLVGPQKSEVVFLVNGEDSRYFCSQGQQRALILSFKMAQIMYHCTTHGDYPVLLLDDVLSELDESNRASLVSFLSELDAQIYLTATEVGQEVKNLFYKHKPNFYEIRHGTIERFSEGYEERANHGESAQ